MLSVVESLFIDIKKEKKFRLENKIILKIREKKEK